MPRRKRHYSLFSPPSLSMSELVCKTLDNEGADCLIDKWLEQPNDAYREWFCDVREKKHAANARKGQLVVWNKGDFIPENIFCRTVDTGRLVPIDRTWTTHVYHHRSMHDRKLSMMPVVFTMLPELMLLRSMHDQEYGCEDIYIIVTDMKRQEMDDATEYFKLVCRHTFGRTCKPAIARKIQYEHMRLSHTLLKQRRTPCFPQIDLTLRAILYEKRPPFIILFSHQPTSYSQILFTHPLFVPSEEIFYDYPTGCPNLGCSEDCEMIRFPRNGAEGASILAIKRGGKYGRRVKAREMCNWVDCDVCFNEDQTPNAESEGSQSSADVGEAPVRSAGQMCSKCKLVRYCSVEHQRMDWEEHRRVCLRPSE